MNNSEFFNSIDYLCLLALFASLFAGFLKGFTKDFFGTCSWFGSIFFAVLLAPYMVPSLQQSIPNPFLAKCAALLLIFVALLAAFKVIVNTLSKGVKSTCLSGVDRMFGAMFGLARGVGILVCMPVLALLFGIHQDRYEIVRESKIMTMLYSLADKLMPKVTKITGMKPPLPAKKIPKPETSASDFSNVPIKKKEKIEEASDKTIFAGIVDYVKHIFDRRYSAENEDVKLDEVTSPPKETVRTRRTKSYVDKYKGMRPKYGIMNLLDAKKKRLKQLREERKKREALQKIQIQKNKKS